jgi:hypothetical protein
MKRRNMPRAKYRRQVEARQREIDYNRNLLRYRPANEATIEQRLAAAIAALDKLKQDGPL